MEELDLEERLEWYFYEFYRLKQEEIRVLRDLQARIDLEVRDPDEVPG